MEIITNITLLTLLLVVATAIIFTSNLILMTIFSGVFSLIMASLFVIMDAVDVALTESAVGAGISTLLLLATIRLVGTVQKQKKRLFILPLVSVLFSGTFLLVVTFGMPPYADPEAPVHQHVVPRYLKESPREVAPIPNVVTTILTSYRGFDTMGEVVVIFTAGVGVLMLLGGRRRKVKSPQENPGQDNALPQQKEND